MKNNERLWQFIYLLYWILFLVVMMGVKLFLILSFAYCFDLPLISIVYYMNKTCRTDNFLFCVLFISILHKSISEQEER